jgi:hypothetical protein
MTPYGLRPLSYDSGIFEHCGPLQVHAVFPHAWHLRSATRQIVSVVASRWNGPLTVCVTTLPHITPGIRARLRDAELEVGRIVISFEEARPWTLRTPQPEMLDPRVLQRDLDTLRHQVRAAARGGLAEALESMWSGWNRCEAAVNRSPTRGDVASSWLVRGRQEIALLREALARQDRVEIGWRAIGLLGLGPGLTPAGDDVLCGLLAGLSVLGRRSIRHGNRCAGARAALADSIVAEAPRRTTSFSRTLLQAATRGVATEPLLQILETVGGGTRLRGVDEVLMLGHSSGRDMLTGALLAGATLVRWEEQFGPAVVGSR